MATPALQVPRNRKASRGVGSMEGCRGPNKGKGYSIPPPTPPKGLPGKPVAYNFGLLWIYYGLLWDIVAYYFGLLGVPGCDHTQTLRAHSHGRPWQ